MNTQKNQFEVTLLKDLAAFIEDNKELASLQQNKDAIKFFKDNFIDYKDAELIYHSGFSNNTIPKDKNFNPSLNQFNPVESLSESKLPIQYLSVLKLQNNKNLPIMTNDAIKRVPVDTLLKMSMAHKDITPGMAATLKNQHDDPVKLNPLLHGFHEQRLHHLMNQSFDDLDKSGDSVELKDKYEEGYNQKKRDRFGGIYKNNDPKSGQINIDKLIDYTKKSPLYDDNVVNGLKFNFGKDPQKFKELVDKIPKNNLDHLKSLSIQDLTKNNKIQDFKKQSLQGFKHKYLEEMGVPHDEKTNSY